MDVYGCVCSCTCSECMGCVCIDVYTRTCICVCMVVVVFLKTIGHVSSSPPLHTTQILVDEGGDTLASSSVASCRQWLRTIRETLYQVMGLLPIATPGFFQHQALCAAWPVAILGDLQVCVCCGGGVCVSDAVFCCAVVYAHAPPPPPTCIHVHVHNHPPYPPPHTELGQPARTHPPPSRPHPLFAQHPHQCSRDLGTPCAACPPAPPSCTTHRCMGHTGCRLPGGAPAGGRAAAGGCSG